MTVTPARAIGWLIVVAAVVAAISWLASPLVAFHAFREAARARDRDGLAELIDYGALRASLAPQLRAAAEASALAQRPPEPDDSVAAIGRRVLERLSRRAAETTLAPLGIDQALEAQLQPPSLARLADGSIEQFRYVSPSRAHVRVRGPSGPLFVLERRRLFEWDLVHVGLPSPVAG